MMRVKNHRDGGIGLTIDRTYAPPLSLTISNGDNPIVAWLGVSGEVYVKRWDGNRWTEFGTGSASEGGVSDSNGYSSHPVVKYGFGRTFVARVGEGTEIHLRRARGP